MGVSLAFHIIFAVVGIGMPALMVIAEHRWRRTGDAGYLELAKRWSRGTAILFAVGAVSGTVLSFELGLLWPEFMKQAGPIIGMPFSLEGFAFFTEAIFLGVYLYGWDRISPRAHVLAGVMVAVSGALSGIFVVIANAWMNTPRGFTLVDGKFTNVDPLAAMMTPAAFPQTLHMTLAAYAATGFAVAGIHAAMLLRDPRNAFHRRAFGIALLVGAPAALIQPLAGDIEARYVARQQPAKLAAMEGLFRDDARGAAERRRNSRVRASDGPDTPSRFRTGSHCLPSTSSNAEVKGLDAFPRDQWPPVAIVHFAFDVMVGLGTFMALVSAAVLFMLWRKREIITLRWMLVAVALCAPMGFLCIEAGWMVTEIGRQPWIIYGILRTADAVTPMPGLIVPFLTFTALYCFLGIIVVLLLYQQVLKSPREDETFRSRRNLHDVHSRRRHRGNRDGLAQCVRSPRGRGLRRRCLGFFCARRPPSGAARSHFACARTHLGGESRLADSRDRSPLHLLSRRILDDRHRASHSAHPHALRHRAAWLGVRFSELRQRA